MDAINLFETLLNRATWINETEREKMLSSTPKLITEEQNERLIRLVIEEEVKNTTF